MSNTVGIDIVARLDNFKAELAKIPGIGQAEARTLASKLSKEIKSAEKAAKDARGATDKLKDSVGAFGDKAGAVGSSAGKLAGALSLLGPGAGDAARNVADFADVGEVAASAAEALGVSIGTMAAALGVVTVALGAGYLAWRSYNEDSEQAAVIAADVSAAYAAMQPILDSTRMATLDLAIATGQLSELEGALAKNRLRAGEAFRSSTKEAADKLKELRKEQGSYLTQAVDMVQSFGEQYDWLGLTTAAFDGVTTSSAELQQRIDALHGTIATTAEATRENVTQTEKLIRAQDGNRKSSRSAATATREQKDATLELVAAQRREAEAFAAKLAAVEAAEARAGEIVKASGDFRLSAMDRLDEKERETLAAYAEQAKAGAMLQEDIERGKTQIAANYAEQRGMLVQAEIETTRGSLETLVTQLDQMQADALNQRRQVARETLSASGDLFGGVSELAEMAAERQGEANKKQAMTLFVVGKAAALAQAAVNTFLAVSKANPNPIAMTAAAVIGAAQVAGIASTPPPSFNDTSGVQQMGVRGNVSLAAGDYFAAARDPAELQRQVGAAAGGSVNVLQVKLGHRVLDQSVARTIQQGGRLSREINRTNRTRPTGHREA